MNFLNKDLNKEIKIYFLLYLLSFGLILFNFNFIYFDDWTLINQKKEDLINIFNEAGNSFFGYIHYFLIEYTGTFSYKVFIFISYFLSGLLLNEILKRIVLISREERVFIVIIFLILPVNFARIALIDFPYAFCYILFFLSFFLFCKYLDNKIFIYRLLSLVLFFISFQVNSFLVFYLIVFFYGLYKLYDNNIKKYAINIVKLIDFWSLPIIFFIFKSIYLIPTGPHASYYEINQEKIMNAFLSTVYIFKRFFYEFFILIPKYTSIEMIVVFYLIIFYIIKRSGLVLFTNNPLSFKILSLFLLGFCLTFISIYPYMVVNTSPSFFDWDSRHMLLLSLGVALCLLSFYSIFNKKIKFIFFLSIIVLFTTINTNIYYCYIIDGIKQDAILLNIKQNKEIKKYNTFIVYDELKEYNNLNRTYRFYEYAGMLDFIYGNQNKFAILADRKISESTLRNYLVSSLKLKNYQKEKKIKKIYIIKGNIDLTLSNVVKALFYKIFLKKEYNNILNKILFLKVK